MSLHRAALAHRKAREALEDAIRQASEEGQSLRSIARQVGWSHEQVRKIIHAKKPPDR